MSFVRLLLVLSFFTAPGMAADLSKIDRTIAKQPKYRSKPKYCLLVFGPEAKTKVWLVLDGDVLYVDRNGNGDLTEEGERVKIPAFSPSTYPAWGGERSIEVGALSVGGLTHTALVISQMEYRRKAIVPNDGILGALTQQEWQEHVDRVWRQVPDGVVSDLRIDLDPECYGLFGHANGRRVRHVAFVDRQGRLAFADCPQDAPIVHFGGPLTAHLRPSEKLPRGQHPEELNFWLGTPGLGVGTFAIMAYDLVPEDVHPVLEVQFPAKEPDQKPITRNYIFSRC